MSEYFHVGKPFLDQLDRLGWTVIDRGHDIIPSDPAGSLRHGFREWLLPDIFRDAVRKLGNRDWLSMMMSDFSPRFENTTLSLTDTLTS